MDIIGWLNSFSQAHPWIPLVISIYIAVVTGIKGIRDAIDKTPLTDDNWFERIATILWKTIAYIGAGIRPKAPEGSMTAPGEMKDAAGTKVIK